ncbi:hypothetical protein QZM66_13140 [Burkholderia contaminans]|uniref:hypothetical protein n=1 Tax=Burkholderia sp. HI4860 TaxID=2015361 RepID=UPI001F60E44E|nr:MULTISPECIES: hypothetical protein [Burkholderia]MCI3967997.1 hypothetical protein [Burkholderia sp. HI4860]MDN7788499.1 hypothetical protein [Burkholderia contaminans]
MNGSYQKRPYAVVTLIRIQTFKRFLPGKLSVWQLHPLGGQHFAFEQFDRELEGVMQSGETIRVRGRHARCARKLADDRLVREGEHRKISLV